MTSTILPMPTLDHVVVNTRDRLDDGQALYERLGFTLTPRGYHTLGSMNHLAILGTHYLELIAVAPGPGARPDILAHPLGLDGLVFGTDDSASTFASLAGAGVAATEPREFSRPVDLPGGPKDAVFRTLHLQPGPGEGVAPVGRVYFCHHLTRDLVWRDEWRHHPNGAIGILRFVIAASDPARLGGFFAGMFGADAVRPLADGGQRVLVELSSIDIMTPAAIAAAFGITPDGGGRDEYMAALCFRTRSLDTAAAALSDVAGIVAEAGRIVVPPAATMGVILTFEE